MHRVGDIRRVIDRLIYDTETAEPIHTHEPTEDQGDFHYFIETLYVSRGGRYFIAGEGGPMSPYTESLGGGSHGGGSGIRSVDISEAVEWLEASGGSDVLASDERFSGIVSEA